MASDLQDALHQIAEIRQRLAAAETFRGYRAAPVAFSGLLAAAAGVFQSVALADPLADLERYLALWVGVAVLSVAAAALDMSLRRRSGVSTLDADQTRRALEQFAPCVVAGLALTIALVSLPRGAELLPGVWQVLLSLGIVSSRSLLPAGVAMPAALYMLSGCVCLAMARGEHALSPWAMALPFAVGQFCIAAVLYQALERPTKSSGSPRP